MRRQLSETLTELLDGLLPVAGGQVAIRVRSVMLDLPLELETRRSTDGVVVCADVPRWRWTTPFDVEPSRLKVRLEEGLPW